MKLPTILFHTITENFSNLLENQVLQLSDQLIDVLFLILQLLVGLYVLSYVAQWFSGITLIFMGKQLESSET